MPTPENEVRQAGACTCGKRVTRILNSVAPTVRRDGSRFVYTDEDDTGWGILRCRGCRKMIDTSWKQDQEPASPQESPANA